MLSRGRAFGGEVGTETPQTISPPPRVALCKGDGGGIAKPLDHGDRSAGRQHRRCRSDQADHAGGAKPWAVLSARRPLTPAPTYASADVDRRAHRLVVADAAAVFGRSARSATFGSRASQ
jgi:hypothetical protein